VLAVGTERAHIARGFVHQAVADHFVFALETFAGAGARAAGDGAVVRPRLGVNGCV
jgi:hypothetical protein